MRITYQGKTEKYRRVAEINYSESEETLVSRMCDLLTIKGWNVVNMVEGYAYCEVEDKQEFFEFAEEARSARKMFKACMKYGF